MIYWSFQFFYVAAVFLWLTGAVLLLREFFSEYRGKVFDDSNLSHRAGLPDHGAVEIPETTEYRDWKAERSLRLKRALWLFIGGIAIHTVLHLSQTYFLPRFEIPFETSPNFEEMQQGPEETA